MYDSQFRVDNALSTHYPDGEDAVDTVEKLENQIRLNSHTIRYFSKVRFEDYS